MSRIADRLLGSPDIYAHKQREAEQSVNFITCHDGFTLNDLVSYNDKHNESNNDSNKDGASDNSSWNCGVEGPTSDPAIERLRIKQIKNFLTVTLLSLGMPMILMGDEVRRTQIGNNNNYCHDDETNWFDWSLLEKHADVHRFVKLLIKRRVLRDDQAQRSRKSLDQLIREAVKGALRPRAGLGAAARRPRPADGRPVRIGDRGGRGSGPQTRAPPSWTRCWSRGRRLPGRRRRWVGSVSSSPHDARGGGGTRRTPPPRAVVRRRTHGTRPAWPPTGNHRPRGLLDGGARVYDPGPMTAIADPDWASISR